MSVRERAEHLITLADAAEPEPWHVEHRWATGHHVASEKEVVCGDFSCGPDPLANAEFVAAVRSEAPWVARQLLEALNRIEAANKLHFGSTNIHGPDGPYCDACVVPWPCPTWLALHPNQGEIS